MATIAALTKLMPNLPVGFGFRPTDEEVVLHYLEPKIFGRVDPQVCSMIPEYNIYQNEPKELPNIFRGNSVIKTKDQVYWFFCRLESKHPNSRSLNRATEYGFWKKTGDDKPIKDGRTNNVIGTKKILMFFNGRVRDGVKTDWVMHEYHPLETLPNQRASVVICRITNNASTRVEGEPSSSNAIPAVFFRPETELGSLLQPNDHDFFSSRQLPINNQQQPFLGNLSFDNNDWMQSDFELAEQLEAAQFADSCFDGPDEYRCEEYMHPSNFIDSDTDTTLLQFQQLVGTSNLFNDRVNNMEHLEMRMVKMESGALPSVYSAADKQINCITLSSPESPVKRKNFKPQDQQRSQNFAAERADPTRNQLQINSNLLKVASKDKAKDAAKHNTNVDLQHKGKSIMESDKERKMAGGTNAKKGLKLTTDESASSNRKGCSSFIFLESSPVRHESRPPSEYFVRVVLGIFLFALVIREVVLFGNWC